MHLLPAVLPLLFDSQAAPAVKEVICLQPQEVCWGSTPECMLLMMLPVMTCVTWPCC